MTSAAIERQHLEGIKSELLRVLMGAPFDRDRWTWHLNRINGALSLSENSVVDWKAKYEAEEKDHRHTVETYRTYIEPKYRAAVEALERLLSYNMDIQNQRINYRAEDHIQVIEGALYPPVTDLAGELKAKMPPFRVDKARTDDPLGNPLVAQLRRMQAGEARVLLEIGSVSELCGKVADLIEQQEATISRYDMHVLVPADEYDRLKALDERATNAREETVEQMSLRVKVIDADRMAGIVDEMVRAGKLDARSPLADARLDYGQPWNPQGMRQGAEMLATTRDRADYWLKGGRDDPNRDTAVLSVEQAANAWMNAAYALAEKIARSSSSSVEEADAALVNGATAECRNAVIEECAKVCEADYGNDDHIAVMGTVRYARFNSVLRQRAESIRALKDSSSATAQPAEDPGTLKIMTALVERAYGIFTASGVLRVAEQDPESNDPIVAWASDVRSILYRNKPAAIDATLQGIRAADRNAT